MHASAAVRAVFGLPKKSTSFALRCHGRSQRGAWGLGPQKGVEKKLHSRFSGAIGANIYVKVLCLVIVNVNVTKYMPQKCQKLQICAYQV